MLIETISSICFVVLDQVEQEEVSSKQGQAGHQLMLQPWTVSLFPFSSAIAVVAEPQRTQLRTQEHSSEEH